MEHTLGIFCKNSSIGNSAKLAALEIRIFLCPHHMRTSACFPGLVSRGYQASFANILPEKQLSVVTSYVYITSKSVYLI